jgi:hypothetical protein
MRRAITILAWMLVAAGLGLVLGGSLFGLLAVLLADPMARPATWPGWNLLFVVFVVGFPAGGAALALLLGSTGRLPGTRRT